MSMPNKSENTKDDITVPLDEEIENLEILAILNELRSSSSVADATSLSVSLQQPACVRSSLCSEDVTPDGTPHNTRTYESFDILEYLETLKKPIVSPKEVNVVEDSSSISHAVPHPNAVAPLQFFVESPRLGHIDAINLTNLLRAYQEGGCPEGACLKQRKCSPCVCVPHIIKKHIKHAASVKNSLYYYIQPVDYPCNPNQLRRLRYPIPPVGCIITVTFDLLEALKTAQDYNVVQAELAQLQSKIDQIKRKYFENKTRKRECLRDPEIKIKIRRKALQSLSERLERLENSLTQRNPYTQPLNFNDYQVAIAGSSRNENVGKSFRMDQNRLSGGPYHEKVGDAFGVAKIRKCGNMIDSDNSSCTSQSRQHERINADGDGNNELSTGCKRAKPTNENSSDVEERSLQERCDDFSDDDIGDLESFLNTLI